MSLNWSWKNRIGRAVLENGKEVQIYEGNALVILINEWVNEVGIEVYSLYNFLTDKAHLKNCIKDKSFNWFKDIKEIHLNNRFHNDLWTWLKEASKQGIKIFINCDEDLNIPF